MHIKSSVSLNALPRKRDMMVACIVGFSFGAFSIPILLNLGIKPTSLLLLMPPVSGLVFIIVLFAAYAATSSISSVYQFAKFGLVGALNSSVDFGVMNSFILTTGVVSGTGFLGIKSASAT